MLSKRNSLRLAAVTTLAALSTGLAGTALAAAPVAAPAVVAEPAPAAQSAPAGQPAAASAAITATPSATSVQAWQPFRVTGTTTGLAAGSTVTLQQKQHGAWVTLPASVRTTRTSSYSLGVKLGIKGPNELRVIGGGAASPVFTVTVR
ncbi:hypothetical protein ACIRD3_29910 [Kitasatospora sp. NPDC093550]|uniref:hypothetical protein n=1 Tax=Kitasatospora sp. NPDC093550 TaxID=3364089 RepID=UPI003827CA70